MDTLFVKWHYFFQKVLTCFIHNVEVCIIWDIKTIKRKTQTVTQKNRVLKVKNSPFELEKGFKPINLSIDNMDKFEENELTKNNTLAKIIWYDWYDWLINYIHESIKTVGGVKDTIISLFKKNIAKDYSKVKCIKNLCGGGKKPRKLKMQRQSEDNIIKNIRHLLR